MRVPEYFWYDPFNSSDLAGFSWQYQTYQPIHPNPQGQLISQVLGLALVKWQGDYKGINNITWLRWATLDGQLLPSCEEIAEQEKQRAEQEKQRADNAESQLKRVVKNFLLSGMSVECTAQITGLSESQVTELAD